jgi:2-succinyl-6-hydroxy-2,4-cyclohexadiene-1-carboxylate synthase
MPALRYDQRGYGETRAVTGPYDHSDDLCAVLDALDIVRCDLVGVSQGGGIALHFSLDHADRVRRLVLISPMLLGWDWSAEWRSRWQEIKELARAGRLDAARQSWWQHPLFDTTRDSAAAPALRASIQRYSGAQWLRDEHRPLPVPDIERLHELATPTLLLTGGRDQPDFRLIAELITASAGRVQRIDRPALGHLLHLEDPVSTAQCIAEFLGADDT